MSPEWAKQVRSGASSLRPVLTKLKTMRRITREIVSAFERGQTLKINNSRTDGTSLWLFDNKIAEWRGGELWITNAGWQSKTTKERLNGLRGVSIHQRRGTWYLNDQAWDGSWVSVEHFVSGPRVEDEVDFDMTSEWTGSYSRPLYAVFHTNDADELCGVEQLLSREVIAHRRHETDTKGEWRPNHFIVVLPADYDRAKRLTDEL